jgi:Tol biopolymer transport system component
LLLAAESEVYPSSWTPDGKTLFYGQQDPEGGRMHKNQIWFLPPQGDPEGNKPRFFLATLFLKNQLRVSPLRVSPDGRWLAYESDESERYEVYVVPFPGLRGKVQISTRGGYSAKWSRSGRELYYVEPDSQRLMSVAVQSGAQLQAGRPQPLFKLTSDASWDVMPDGTRFLVERKPEKQETTTFGVITGWFEDLRRRVSEKH